ncbi:Adenine/guanine permease AZG1 [Platanthera zijinensis]|uniref:Adenine/guanine permease AZG1 n=1 Tax=Platanthera zijinensis TaxID=2320716 RepID=A0AAP0B369_9ASPA
MDISHPLIVVPKIDICTNNLYLYPYIIILRKLIFPLLILHSALILSFLSSTDGGVLLTHQSDEHFRVILLYRPLLQDIGSRHHLHHRAPRQHDHIPDHGRQPEFLAVNASIISNSDATCSISDCFHPSPSCKFPPEVDPGYTNCVARARRELITVTAVASLIGSRPNGFLRQSSHRPRSRHGHQLLLRRRIPWVRPRSVPFCPSNRFPRRPAHPPLHFRRY